MLDLINIYDARDEDGTCLPYKSFFFPGGEPHAEVEAQWVENRPVWVDARIATAGGFMQLLAVLDAIRTSKPSKLGLFLPYFPGARQDRRQPRFPFTLEIYANALKQMELDALIVVDPHSYALANRLNLRALYQADVFDIPKSDYVGLIQPDVGAEYRTSLLAGHLALPVVHAHKVRDSLTGKLSGFTVEKLPQPGRYLLADDICDGGRTFIGVAEAIAKDNNNYTLDLLVTHGIFSKGLTELRVWFDRIYTTDSFPSESVTATVNGPSTLIVSTLFWRVAGKMKQLLIGTTKGDNQ